MLVVVCICVIWQTTEFAYRIFESGTDMTSLVLYDVVVMVISDLPACAVSANGKCAKESFPGSHLWLCAGCTGSTRETRRLAAAAVSDGKTRTGQALAMATSAAVASVVRGSAVVAQSLESYERRHLRILVSEVLGEHFPTVISMLCVTYITNVSGSGGSSFLEDAFSARLKILTTLLNADSHPDLKSVRPSDYYSSPSSVREALGWRLNDPVVTGVTTAMSGYQSLIPVATAPPSAPSPSAGSGAATASVPTAPTAPAAPALDAPTDITTPKPADTEIAYGLNLLMPRVVRDKTRISTTAELIARLQRLWSGNIKRLHSQYADVIRYRKSLQNQHRFGSTPPSAYNYQSSDQHLPTEPPISIFDAIFSELTALCAGEFSPSGMPFFAYYRDRPSVPMRGADHYVPVAPGSREMKRVPKQTDPAIDFWVSAASEPSDALTAVLRITISTVYVNPTGPPQPLFRSFQDFEPGRRAPQTSNRSSGGGRGSGSGSGSGQAGINLPATLAAALSGGVGGSIPTPPQRKFVLPTRGAVVSGPKSKYGNANTLNTWKDSNTEPDIDPDDGDWAE